MFGTLVSIFHRRYQCLQTAKEENEDFISYSCKVNRACVNFMLGELREEQFKYLIFGCVWVKVSQGCRRQDAPFVENQRGK